MFGNTIKKLRERHDMTQQQLAKILNVSTSTVGKWEGKGNVIPSAEILIELAKCFDVSIDYLLGDSSLQQERSDRRKEYVSLFNMLSDDEQRIVLLQIKGIVSGKSDNK